MDTSGSTGLQTHLYAQFMDNGVGAAVARHATRRMIRLFTTMREAGDAYALLLSHGWSARDIASLFAPKRPNPPTNMEDLRKLLEAEEALVTGGISAAAVRTGLMKQPQLSLRRNDPREGIQAFVDAGYRAELDGIAAYALRAFFMRREHIRGWFWRCHQRRRNPLKMLNYLSDSQCTRNMRAGVDSDVFPERNALPMKTPKIPRPVKTSKSRSAAGTRATLQTSAASSNAVSNAAHAASNANDAPPDFSALFDQVADGADADDLITDSHEPDWKTLVREILQRARYDMWDKRAETQNPAAKEDDEDEVDASADAPFDAAEESPRPRVRRRKHPIRNWTDEDVEEFLEKNPWLWSHTDGGKGGTGRVSHAPEVLGVFLRWHGSRTIGGPFISRQLPDFFFTLFTEKRFIAFLKQTPAEAVAKRLYAIRRFTGIDHVRQPVILLLPWERLDVDELRYRTNTIQAYLDREHAEPLDTNEVLDLLFIMATPEAVQENPRAHRATFNATMERLERGRVESIKRSQAELRQAALGIHAQPRRDDDPHNLN
jgi:hypothetical protein